MQNKGNSLIELLLAIALTAIILPALLTGLVASRENKAQEEQRLMAIALLKESEEAVRSVREVDWNTFAVDGTYHPEISGTSWVLVAGSEVIDGFTREVSISSGSDLSIKQVYSSVSWADPQPGGVVESSQILTRYVSNSVAIHTTQSDFDAGTKSNTESGSSGLIQLTSTITRSLLTDDYTVSGDYSYDSNKVEITGGFAQLKASGGGSTSTTLNSDFVSNSANWSFVSYGNSAGQKGNWNNSGGNPSGNITVDFKKSKNNVSGGYWYQGFTISSPAPSTSLQFDWSVGSYQASPDSFHIYAWIDTGLGTPSTVVWDSGNITSTTGWGSQNIDISSYVTTPGTYYVKVGAYVDYPSSNIGGYSVTFDNVLVTWAGGGGSYPSDSPSIEPNTSFQPSSVTSWDSFTATEVANGGSIMYQLSDDDGATWQYWKNIGQGWITAGSTDYNSASDVDSNISTFPITSGKILVKAFLIGDGTQFVQLDKVVIGFSGTGGGSNTGDFISSTIDAGSEVAFNRFIWTESNTANTTTQFQIAINSDNGTWNYVGPDGTNATFFEGGLGQIPLSIINGRYFRYKIYFTSSNTDIPNVSEVSINYSP